jgi:aspartyl-tRNA(Asn)/glutamyl-tRNA(Gln) amidotransferase subunit B
VDIIESRGLKQISDSSELEAIVDQVIADCPGQVEQYRDGKTRVIGFLVGQVMKATEGKANPGQVNQILRDKLS